MTAIRYRNVGCLCMVLLLHLLAPTRDVEAFLLRPPVHQQSRRRVSTGLGAQSERCAAGCWPSFFGSLLRCLSSRVRESSVVQRSLLIATVVSALACHWLHVAVSRGIDLFPASWGAGSGVVDSA